MNEESIHALLEDLKEMAATITTKETAELQQMKADLDDYVESITSKIPDQSIKIVNREFDKCRICASEWINVYCDTFYHKDVKTDILREEAVDFFFTMDEKVIEVQKNFFMLGMLDELIKPGAPFSEQKRAAKIANSRIRILAREQGLTASCKNRPVSGAVAEIKDRLWFFGDEQNFLQSSEAGLTDKEAIDYLLR